MLVVKTLHLWMVISWFAGLFYLPRIFVNLAMVPADSVAERDRLLLMAGRATSASLACSQRPAPSNQPSQSQKPNASVSTPPGVAMPQKSLRSMSLKRSIDIRSSAWAW